MRRDQLEHVLRAASQIAGREKDYAFAAALIDHGLINPAVIADRIETVGVSERLRLRLRSWIAHHHRS